jgi:hypothetical protein
MTNKPTLLIQRGSEPGRYNICRVVAADVCLADVTARLAQSEARVSAELEVQAHLQQCRELIQRAEAARTAATAAAG